jgi:hypothetical protein
MLNANDFKHYVDRFNADDVEDVVNLIPNAGAWDWIANQAPLFECPDKSIEEIYYYRWWTFRKHIKQTPAGRVITEFILPVKHAGVHNTVSCALCHHIAEARWLKDQTLLDEWISFWFRGNEGKPQPHFHKYSQWIAAAIWDRARVTGDIDFAIGLLYELVSDYRDWETEKRLPGGMFWQYDVWDGMEESISGSRKNRNPRPTINSYMYANARAISEIAAASALDDLATAFRGKAADLKTLVEQNLWDAEAQFFKVMLENRSLSDAREEIGFIPWCFNLPDAGKEAAWKQLIDPQGFWAPFGITTAERRHPKFRSHGVGHCEWDGAVWPFATSQTLDALANVLRHYEQSNVTRAHYLKAMQIYAKSHHVNGKPYIGEYLDEVTGEWLKGDNPRSRYYNHSTFCNLVICGLVGVQPRADGSVEVSPLLPTDGWDWFCLDQVRCHRRPLTVIWDRTGEKYGRRGLSLLAGGERVAHSNQLESITWNGR